MIVGKYINKNYKYEPFIPDIPYIADTLIINKDGSFKSLYYGNGEYVLSYSIKGTMIDLIYKYELGKAGRKASVSKKFFGNPKINLFKEKNHYYKKIE